MVPTTPKFLPTLICLTLVGLAAALLPYPGLEYGIPLMPQTAKQ